ncbi:MAG TPA: hypothetical protein PLW05_10745 [Candidatus Marinimicrobia bacterium]|nr:hypothetical protein [Candidatus Neomarinimicrobiota bacterium]
MGTQQILLIVLSSFVVGIAVIIGITMFHNQAINTNRQAVISDLNNFAAQAVAYYKLTESMGGGGNGSPGFGEGDNPSTILLSYLGFVQEGSGEISYKHTNDVGTYSITSQTAHTLTINGVGKEKVGASDNVEVNLSINMAKNPGQQITITVVH